MSYAQVFAKSQAAQAQQAAQALGLKPPHIQGSWAIFELEPSDDTFQEQLQSLSSQLGSLAIGFMNQDNTRLVVSTYRAGIWLDQFDSNPMHLNCRVCTYAEAVQNGEAGNAQTLAELFGVPQQTKALQHWLMRKRGMGFLYEHQRHQAIAELLGLPSKAVA